MPLIQMKKYFKKCIFSAMSLAETGMQNCRILAPQLSNKTSRECSQTPIPDAATIPSFCLRLLCPSLTAYEK